MKGGENSKREVVKVMAGAAGGRLYRTFVSSHPPSTLPRYPSGGVEVAADFIDSPLPNSSGLCRGVYVTQSNSAVVISLPQ